MSVDVILVHTSERILSYFSARSRPRQGAYSSTVGSQRFERRVFFVARPLIDFADRFASVLVSPRRIVLLRDAFDRLDT